MGEAREPAAAHVHLEDVRIGAFLQAHHHAVALRREARRKRHIGEVAQHLLLPRHDVAKDHARLAIAIGGVGYLLRKRMKARREHKLAALCQKPQICAVLIHDREALDPLVLGAGLVDKDDAAIEIAFLAGQALVDRVGDDVREPARCVRRDEELLARDLPRGVIRPKAGIRP